jgi:hypothetical protein
MRRYGQAVITLAICLVAPLAAGSGAALADDIPAAGQYQCSGASGPTADLNFTVGPGNIYTTKKGFRGVMVIHPGTGNVLFHGAAPQSAYQGRYSSGPPPQVRFVTVSGGESSDAGIMCQLVP